MASDLILSGPSSCSTGQYVNFYAYDGTKPYEFFLASGVGSVSSGASATYCVYNSSITGDATVGAIDKRGNDAYANIIVN